MEREINMERIKEHQKKIWSDSAEGWYKQRTALKSADVVTDRMLKLAGLNNGQKVLDIASGTGEPALRIAKKLNDSGKVIGTDLSAEMLTYARKNASFEGLKNIEFRCMDGENLEFESSTFDIVIIRWGLMFMPNPNECLTQAHRVLKEKGTIVISCWSSPDKNPFISHSLSILKKYIQIPTGKPQSPGIFALANPKRLTQLLKSAGYRDLTMEEMELNAMEYKTGEEYWKAMEDTSGPIMSLMNKLDSDTRTTIIDEIIRGVEVFRENGKIKLKGTTWIASAVK